MYYKNTNRSEKNTLLKRKKERKRQTFSVCAKHNNRIKIKNKNKHTFKLDNVYDKIFQELNIFRKYSNYLRSYGSLNIFLWKKKNVNSFKYNK